MKSLIDSSLLEPAVPPCAVPAQPGARVIKGGRVRVGRMVPIAFSRLDEDAGGALPEEVGPGRQPLSDPGREGFRSGERCREWSSTEAIDAGPAPSDVVPGEEHGGSREGAVTAPREPRAPREDGTKEAEGAGASGASYAGPRQEDVEAALEEARKEGFSKGLEEGKAAAELELERAREEARRIVESARERATREAQALVHSLGLRIVGLALDISKKIIQEEVSARPGVILKVAAAALSRAKGGDVAVIRANPQDMPVIEDGKSQLQGRAGRFREIRVEGDANITRGGCIVETDGGVVDSSVEAQLEELGKTLESSFDVDSVGA